MTYGKKIDDYNFETMPKSQFEIRARSEMWSAERRGTRVVAFCTLCLLLLVEAAAS